MPNKTKKQKSKNTSHVQMFDGIPCVVHNETEEVDTKSKHWYVSYNNHDVAIYGSDTTALVLGQMEYFLILKGDHREHLNKAIQTKSLKPTRGEMSGLGRCLKYVRDHKDELHPFSDPII